MWLESHKMEISYIIMMERNRRVAKVEYIKADDDYDDVDDDFCSHTCVIWWHDDDYDDDYNDDDDDICSHICVIWWHAGKIAVERARPFDHSNLSAC